MLPSNFPDTVNCVDDEGLKQGSWLIYNSVKPSLNELSPQFEPIIIETYRYGNFTDGKEIGTWKTVNNQHNVYVVSKKHYSQKLDTIILTNEMIFDGTSVTKTLNNKNSNFISYTRLFENEDYPLRINCEAISSDSITCKLRYKDCLIKTFSRSDFEFEKEVFEINAFREIKFNEIKNGCR